MAGCWNEIAIPSAAALSGDKGETRLSPNAISPALGCKAPEMMPISVDFPAPFSPRIA